jgi:hypothetical protein
MTGTVIEEDQQTDAGEKLLAESVLLALLLLRYPQIRIKK